VGLRDLRNKQTEGKKVEIYNSALGINKRSTKGWSKANTGQQVFVYLGPSPRRVDISFWLGKGRVGERKEEERRQLPSVFQS